MRSQILVIPLVLLLIVAATLPGISFSLTSSVTSYNNSIIIVDGPTYYGLYKDVNCIQQWNGPAFGSGVVKVNDLNGTYKVPVDQNVGLNSDSVYIDIPDTVGADSSIVVNIVYSGGSISVPSESPSPFFQITFTDVETGVTKMKEVNWGAYSDSFSVSGGKVYSVSITLVLKETTIAIGSPDPRLEFDFTTISGSCFASNANNELRFEHNTGGLSITSGDHFVDGPFSGSNYGVSNGVAYPIENGNDHFWTKDSSATATIKTNDDSNIYLYADLGTGKNSFIVVVNDGSVDKSITMSYTNGQKQYLGLDSQGKLVSSTTLSGLKAFSGSITITVTAVAGNQGQGNYLDLVVIQVPKQTEGTT